MYRKIGEVAELLGITPSAIRKYEEKGILKSKRQTGNDYRQYDVHDIAKLIRARMYKNMGFSILETAEILNNTRLNEYADVIERKKKEIADEILYRQRMIALMDDWKNEISEIGGTPHIEYSPAVYFIRYFYDYRLISDPKQIRIARNALVNVPISYPGFMVREGVVRSGEELILTVGVHVQEKDAERLRITKQAGVMYYPSRMCMTCTIKSAKEQPVSLEQMQELLKYMNAHGFRPTGDVLGKFILSDYELEDYTYYSKIWIPFD